MAPKQKTRRNLQVKKRRRMKLERPAKIAKQLARLQQYDRAKHQDFLAYLDKLTVR